MALVPVHQALGLGHRAERAGRQQSLHGDRPQVDGDEIVAALVVFRRRRIELHGKDRDDAIEPEKGRFPGAAHVGGLGGGEQGVEAVARAPQHRDVAAQHQHPCRRVRGERGHVGLVIAVLGAPVERIDGITEAGGALGTGG
jgi:hypothetical protein